MRGRLRIGYKINARHVFEWTMLEVRQVISVTEFLRNPTELIAQITETRKPVVLTVKGKPPLVVHCADSYQELMERLGNTRFVATNDESQEETGSTSYEN
jgi:prevent-host-death family protein